MEKKIVISLNQKEAIWAERIILDKDREEALKFIENILIKKLEILLSRIESMSLNFLRGRLVVS